MSLRPYTRRIFAAAALAAGLWATAVPAAPTTQDQSGWYEDALVRFGKGDFQGALIQLKNVLQENPTNLPARILLGRTYLRLGAPVDAEKELETAARIGADDELIVGHLAESYLLQHKYKQVLSKILPGNRSPHIEAAVMGARATAYYEQYRYEDAKQDFETARSLAPDDPIPVLGLARVAVRQGEIKEATRLATMAAEINPNHHDVWYVRGEIYKVSNEHEAAVQSYSRAIELVPAHFPARIARAGLLLQLNRAEKALEDLEYAREFDRLDPQSAYLMALALARTGDRRAAMDALREADLIIRNTEPGFLRSHAPSMLVAGMVNYAQGKFDEARLYLQDYVRLVPRHIGASRVLATILLKKRETKTAIELLERILQIDPENWQALSLMGAAMMQNNNHEASAEYYEQALKIKPDGTGLRTRLAMSRLATGDSDLAVEELKTVVETGSRTNRPTAMLGFLHIRRGEYDEALAVADELLLANPRNPLALNLRGGALIGKGDFSAGRESLRQALDIAPDYKPAVANLARLELAEGRVDAAKNLYENALARNPNNARAMRALGNIAISQNDTGLAIQWLEKAVAADRKDIDTQIKLIRLYQQEGKADRVQYLTHELKQANPSNIRVLETVGQLEFRSGFKDKAIATFQRMANMRPDSPDDLSRIAELQLAVDDTEGAYNTLKRAVWVDNSHQQALSSLIRLEARTRRTDSALERARQLQVDNPASDLGDRLLGEVLVSMKQYDEAIATFRQALAKNESAENVLRLHLAQRAMGDQNAALQTLKTWEARFGGDRRFARAQAAAYIDAGEHETAIRAHEALLARTADDPELLNNLAWLYESVGDERALATAERAYRLKPDGPAIMDTLGWILVQRGDAARGLTLLREAHARASVDPLIRYHLAVALARLGRTSEAVDQLREVMRSSNSDVKAQAETLMKELGS